MPIRYSKRLSRRARIAFVTAIFLGNVAQSEEVSAPGFKLEVCFVLDTTGSMSGLIEGAKRKIWSIANNVVAITPTPEVHFSLIGYRDRGDAYITKVTDLTGDMDLIYQQLKAFTADGGGDGPESVNQALYESVHHISWSEDEEQVIKIVFLVGDFPPHMDYPQEQQYPATVRDAVAKGVLVSAIQAGNNQETELIWKQIASMGGGIYSKIAQSGGMETLSTHFDQDLVALNFKLGDTLLPYGSEEQRAQIESLQTESQSMPDQELSDRASYNARTNRIIQSSGDLIDDLDLGVVTLETIPEEHLPQNLRQLHPDERVAYIARVRATRRLYQKTVRSLAEMRQQAIREQQNDVSFDRQVVSLIKEIAASKRNAVH